MPKKRKPERRPSGVWVTRYAMTRGVFYLFPSEAVGLEYVYNARGRIRSVVATTSSGKVYAYRMGVDAFTRKVDALEKAEVVRAKELRKLRSRIRRLKSMVFEDYLTAEDL